MRETEVIRRILDALENILNNYKEVGSLSEKYHKVRKDLDDTRERLQSLEDKIRLPSTADLDMSDNHGQKPN